MSKLLMAVTGLVTVPLPYLKKLLQSATGNATLAPTSHLETADRSFDTSSGTVPPALLEIALTLDLGTILAGDKRLKLLEDVLLQHLVVLGGSGTGKSRLLELLARIFLHEGRGCLYLDPNGDTSESLLLFALEIADEEGNDAVLRQTVYLEPGFAMVFGVDPFIIHLPEDLSPAQREAAYFAALHNKADELSEIVQAKQGNADFAGMARLQRILRDVFIAVGTPVNSDGQHLPLSEVFVLLDRHHGRHEEVLALVYPHLPREVQADFDSLAAYRSEEQRKREVESTINRLRSLLAPVVQNLFSATRHAIVNFKNLIREQKIVLVNLRKTDFLSADQRSAIGMIILHQVLSAAEACPPEERQNFFVIADEAKFFLSERLCQSLEQFRKFRTGVILAAQSAYQFVRGDIDMLPAILDACGSLVCFQQKYSESLHELKQFFGYANLSFEKFRDIRQRDGGDELLEIPEQSFTLSGGTNWNHVDGKQEGFSQEQAIAEVQNWQRSVNSGGARTAGQSLAQDPLHRETTTKNSSITLNSGQGSATGGSAAKTIKNGHTTGTSTSDSLGGNNGWSKTVNLKKVLHHRIIEEEYETPQLKDSVADQLDYHAHLIRIMPPRHAMASFFGQPHSVIFRVDDVNDIIPDPKERAEVLRQLKARIYSLHDFYFVPDLSPTASDRRLVAFLTQTRVGHAEQMNGKETETQSNHVSRNGDQVAPRKTETECNGRHRGNARHSRSNSAGEKHNGDPFT